MYFKQMLFFSSFFFSFSQFFLLLNRFSNITTIFDENYADDLELLGSVSAQAESISELGVSSKWLWSLREFR